jgi:PAS domain S-box-containing protein
MQIQEHSHSFINRLIRIDSDDSDDSRRRQLLNIILLGVFLLTVILVAIIGIYVAIYGLGTNPNDIIIVFATGLGLLLGTAVIYMVNHYVRGGIASIVFLFFLVIIFNFADSPDQIANGRSIILFSIPIIMASILLKPYLSFVFAGITSIDIIIIAILNKYPPNFPAITVFFLLALVSWLSARSLEQALKELRTTNANLDRIVQERTKELAKALSRERIEAGRSKAILESIADGVIVFDIHGKAIEINPAIVRLLEMPFEHIRGTTIDELTRSKALDSRNRGILAGLLSNSGQHLTSYRVLWERKTLSVSSSQVFDNEGTRIGTVAVFRDFTREAEVEKMKNTFLAMVSHELRTPLNAILGYAEMLKESIYGPVNEKQARTTERIMSNSRRLLDIVSDLLDQAQMEAGKLTIMARPFKPVELLDNVHGVMDKIAADKGLALASNLDPELPEWLTGDQARLQQILINLINNSIKFTRTGSVHFRAFRRDKKHWALEVRDTGIGIPEEEISLVFESFHQVDSTTSREHGGFGLGLSIVKQLANLMGGEVNVSSQLEKGSTFTVVLPMVVSRRRISK